jgi:hypothetical protein
MVSPSNLMVFVALTKGSGYAKFGLKFP